MQATDIDFSPDTPSFRVTTCRRLMPQGTSCSLLHAVTQPLHSMQRSVSQRNFIRAIMCLLLCRCNPAKRCFGFLHLCHGIVAIGGGRVARLTPDIGGRAFRITVIEVFTLEPATEMEGCPDRSGAHSFSDHGPNLDLSPFGTLQPDIMTVYDTGIGRIFWVDFREHFRLQFGEPWI